MERCDVLVVGAGPGGSAAALSLARQGMSVMIVDRSLPRAMLGESLPPTATPILQQLGLWERFLAGNHIPSYGNRSIWGTAHHNDTDFIRSPYGRGWHLDRRAFDELMKTRLGDLGVSLVDGTRVLTCRRNGEGGWTVTLRAEACHRQVDARFIIDATGRARQVARQLGVQRRRYDRLIGLVGTLGPDDGGVDRDTFTLVEAVADGWWYANPISSHRLVVGFMTDGDSSIVESARTATGWKEHLRTTVEIQERIRCSGYRLTGDPAIVSAESSCLDHAAGDGWCAVGDAAAAHDPLSSLGITAALQGGLQAAEAIVAGREVDLAAYAARVQNGFDRYLAEWLGYYALEQRWPESVFWRRRHAILQRLLA